MTLTKLAMVLIIVYMFPIYAMSQEIKGGTVTYEQMNFIDFNNTPTGNTERDNFFANLPKGQKVGKVLNFNERYSLYTRDDNSSIQPLEGRQRCFLHNLLISLSTASLCSEDFRYYC